MSAKMAFYAIALLLGGGSVAVAALFVLQNINRSSQLSLDLYFAAWQLQEPVPVMALVGGAFAVGLLLGGLASLSRAFASRRTIKQLRNELSLLRDEAAFR